MATAKKNLGKMPCPCCGGPVAVKQAETGTLSYTCQEAGCEATGYAQAHTQAARKWLTALGVGEEPKKAAPPAPPAPEKKPPPKGGFAMGDL